MGTGLSFYSDGRGQSSTPGSTAASRVLHTIYLRFCQQNLKVTGAEEPLTSAHYWQALKVRDETGLRFVLPLNFLTLVFPFHAGAGASYLLCPTPRGHSHPQGTTSAGAVCIPSFASHPLSTPNAGPLYSLFFSSAPPCGRFPGLATANSCGGLQLVTQLDVRHVSTRVGDGGRFHLRR